MFTSGRSVTVLFTMLVAFGTVVYSSAMAQTRPATTQASDAVVVPTPPIDEDFKPTESEATIGTSDLLRITIEIQGALNTQMAGVAASGKLTLPDIGDLPASGLTPEQLEESIQKKLADAGKAGAVVTIEVVESRSLVFYIVNVRTSGMYKLPSRDFKLSEAIRMAGGPTEAAGPTILVIRKADGRQIEVPTEKVKAGEAKSDIVIRPGDRVQVQLKR